MSQAERVEQLQEWLNKGGWPVDADDLLSWIGRSDLEVSDMFDPDGPEVQAIRDEAIQDYLSYDANQQDVSRALRPRASEL